MRERWIEPTPDHRAFREEAIALLKKHASHLDAKDMLALAAHLVGQLIAMQDQRTMTSEMALQIVGVNIEAGNAEVIDNLGNSAGSA